ncbi:hypothetical protein KGO95_02975 [Patescibacteria group bacterium]|nr:hypothetical protein [Patescibacteria group bacterium]
MSWIIHLFAAATLFIGSLFGVHQQVQNAPAPVPVVNEQVQTQNTMNAQPAPMTSAPSGYQASGVAAGGVAYVGNNTPANAGALPDCPAGTAFFDTAPLKDLTGIEPLGHMNGEHILPSQGDHVYLLGSASASSAVYAPGDATLLAVAESTGIAGADQGTNTVTLYFSPCKSVMFAFQMNSLSPEVQRALAGIPPASEQSGSVIKSVVYGPIAIPLTSGELLGTAVPFTGQPSGVDFAATDVRTAPLQFIDQGEQTGMLADSYLHAVCPLDYFSSQIRSQLYSLLTIKNAGQNGIPPCGTTMQDKPGTAQGDWYDMNVPAAAYQGLNESALLAIGHSNLDASQGVISFGTALLPTRWLGTQIIFTPAHSGLIDREPSEITADSAVYCFDGQAGAGGHGPEGHVDIRLDSAIKMEVDYAPGVCDPVPVITNPIVYTR